MNAHASPLHHLTTEKARRERQEAEWSLRQEEDYHEEADDDVKEYQSHGNL
jgi:hypothetical protein